MAEIATIARPYAEAVFKVADGEGKLPAWADVLDRLAAVAANPAIGQLLGDPNVTPDQLYGVIAGGAGDLPAEAQNLVRVLIENGRVGVLPEVRDLFVELKHEREGVACRAHASFLAGAAARSIPGPHHSLSRFASSGPGWGHAAFARWCSDTRHQPPT